MTIRCPRCGRYVELPDRVKEFLCAVSVRINGIVGRPIHVLAERAGLRAVA